MIVVKVLEKDETLDANKLVLGIPDENGLQITLNVDLEDEDAVKVGGQYTLSFMPFVESTHPDAVATPVDTPATQLVPVDHPLVLLPTSDLQPAEAEDVAVPVAPVTPTDAATVADVIVAVAADPTTVVPATPDAAVPDASAGADAAPTDATSGQ